MRMMDGTRARRSVGLINLMEEKFENI